MRRFLLLLLCCGLIGTWLIYFLVPAPRHPELWGAAEVFHQFIEPCPPTFNMCAGAANDEPVPDQATYRLEVRVVTIPFGTPPITVPLFTGYLSDLNHFQFLQGVMGDVRCSTLVWPVSTISDAKQATMSSGSVSIQVKKTNDHFELKYTQPSGITYTQEFDLPEGITFATNLGEHPVIQTNYRIGPSLLDPLFIRIAPLQYEQFLLFKYSEIEESK